MTQYSNHNTQVVSQFTKQAIPFTKLAGHLDSLDILLKVSDVTINDNVLDVASGPGLVAASFAKIAQHVECLDLTPAMLQQAETKAEVENIKNMSFCEGDAMSLPYEDNCFDVVITRYSFHHFLEPDKVLQEMIRVCKSGGRVLVADVALEKQYMEKFNAIERLRDSSHASALSVDQFEALFSSKSFGRCSKTNYFVDVELEKQLSVSFPKEDDTQIIRDLITQNIDHNQTGFNPRMINNEVIYSYPIAVYVGVKI